MMISHTNLKRPDVDHPRLVSLEHAKLVTSHGGIVGSVGLSPVKSSVPEIRRTPEESPQKSLSSTRPPPVIEACEAICT